MIAEVWLPERCAGRGGGWYEPGRDPADVALEEASEDGMIPDVVDCEDPAPGLCWPCLSDFLIVLGDVPFELADLDVGMASGLDGAAVTYQELASALEAFAVGWLDLEQDDYTDTDIWYLADQVKEACVPPRVLRPAVLALAAIDWLRSNVDEPELRIFARDITTASVRARDVIFIERTDK